MMMVSMRSCLIACGCTGLAGFLIGKACSKPKEPEVVEEPKEAFEGLHEHIDTKPLRERYEESRRNREEARVISVNSGYDRTEAIEVKFEEPKKNLDQVREISAGELDNMTDPNIIFLKFVKDTCELFDEYQEPIEHPRILLHDIWDGLEDRDSWPIIVYNEELDEVYEIDELD